MGAQVGTSVLSVVRGPNGSGKTTLLREFLETGNIAQLPDVSARIRTSGLVQSPFKESTNDWAHKNARDVAAYVDPLPLSRDLTVLEHLQLVATSWGRQSDDAVLQAKQALTDFRIEELQARLPHQVSLGQSQLISLALTFVRPARIIVLDEPERHLDNEHTALLSERISQRSNGGTSFLVATHNPSISRLANYTIEL